jgi:hypothetical protein
MAARNRKIREEIEKEKKRKSKREEEKKKSRRVKDKKIRREEEEKNEADPSGGLLATPGAIVPSEGNNVPGGMWKTVAHLRPACQRSCPFH